MTAKNVKVCAVCGDGFTAQRSTAKYCGQLCKDRFTNGARKLRKAECSRPRRKRGNTARCEHNAIAPLLRVSSQHIEVICDTGENGNGFQKLLRQPYPEWFDDYVMGACYVSMIEDQGRLDISPSDVRRICKLDEISVEGVQSLIWNHAINPVGERQAQRLVKVALIALDGIGMYLDRNPALKVKLVTLSQSVSEFDRESAEIDRQFFAEWEEIKARKAQLASQI